MALWAGLLSRHWSTESEGSKLRSCLDTFKEKEKDFRQAFQNCSWDAISRKETYHFIFQTTYPRAPTVMSKNFWMLSNFEEQDASFGNRGTVAAWMWWLSRSRAVLGRWQNVHLLPLRGQLLSSCWTWLFPRLHSQQISPNSAVQKTRLQSFPTLLVQGSLQPCSQSWDLSPQLHEEHEHRVCMEGFIPEHQKAVKASALPFHVKEKYCIWINGKESATMDLVHCFLPKDAEFTCPS